MTRRIRAAFSNNLKAADWMDELTKESAREKVYLQSRELIHPRDLNSCFFSEMQLSK